jgi:hypothetical protein
MALNRRRSPVALRLLAVPAVATVILGAAACTGAGGHPPASAAGGASSGAVRASASAGDLDEGETAHHYIPATGKAVVVAYRNRNLSVVTDRNRFGPVTITDTAKVASLVDLINSAPVGPPMSCPAPMGTVMTMQLQFRTAPAGSTVIVTSYGCWGMNVVIPGRLGFLLAGGPDTIARIEEILDLPWPVPSP